MVECIVATRSTPMSAGHLQQCMLWMHAGWRDLVQYILHWIAHGHRQGMTAEATLQALWNYLSRMQR